MSINAEQRYSLKLKAAFYYYKKDYTQTRISEMLGISRVTLGKLLSEAKDEGMVRIEVSDPRNSDAFLEIEETIRSRFDLLDVVVVDCPENNIDDISVILARAGARYLERYLQSGMKVGMAWGKTLEHLVDNLSVNRSIDNLEVVTLLGGAGVSYTQMQPNVLAQRFLDKYSGRGYLINAPYLCVSEELRNALIADPQIQNVIDKAAQTDLCVVGIGGMPCLGSNGIVDPAIIDELLSVGAVGDVCANYFNARGQQSDTSVSRRMLGVDAKCLRNIKRVIAVAGGPNKGAAVMGALRGKFCNTLITDRFTAAYVLENSR